jgi:hypothetical protein
MSSIFYDDESLRSGLTGETTGLRARDRVLDFDPNSIITGPCVYVRKKFCYVGHATTAYSVDNAANIVDYIGEKTGCDHCLPFAVRLVEGGEIVKFSEGTVFLLYGLHYVYVPAHYVYVPDSLCVSEPVLCLCV